MRYRPTTLVLIKLNITHFYTFYRSVYETIYILLFYMHSTAFKRHRVSIRHYSLCELLVIRYVYMSNWELRTVASTLRTQCGGWGGVCNIHSSVRMAATFELWDKGLKLLKIWDVGLLKKFVDRIATSVCDGYQWTTLNINDLMELDRIIN